MTLLMWNTARAQSETPPGSPPSVPTATISEALDAKRSKGAWERYHDAFKAIAGGETLKGHAMLRTLIETYGDHPAARYATEILATLDAKPAKAPRATPPASRATSTAVESPMPDDPFGREEPADLARAELAVYQTLFGITGGALLCAGVSCEDARLVVGLVALGGAGGLALSILGTQDGITPGRTQTLNAGAGWGIFNGIAMANLAGLDGGAAPGLVLFSQLAGVGAGLALNTYYDPRSGDVSRATSLGLWSGVLTLLVHGAFDFDANDDLLWGTLMLFSDLGLVAGATLGALDAVSMTRGRVLLIDAGGIVGGLLGFGIPVLIQNDTGDSGLLFGSAFVGTVVGLGLTTYLTRHWDVPEALSNMSLGFAPMSDGGGAMVFGARF
ncbi:MAG: hypothetical protein IPK13_02635 [Deltaproteobacteria bacterium]|nr:hypothetical protein [Deltaproteobacteria bacterium]